MENKFAKLLADYKIRGFYPPTLLNGDIVLITKGPFRHHQYMDQEITIRNIRTNKEQTIDFKWFFSNMLYCSEDQQTMLRNLYT